MTGLGTVIVDGQGGIVAADAAFGATMRAAVEDLIGRNLLDFVSLADREGCITVLARIATTRESGTAVKRMIRADGTHMWAQNTFTLVDASDLEIRIALAEGAPPHDWVEPSCLLGIARLFFDGRRRRDAVFGDTLFADHAWDILLAAYIAEAEGRVLTLNDLQRLIGISIANVGRWMRALGADGLLEFEDGSNAALDGTPLRLSCTAHCRLESLLRDLHRDRSSHAPVNRRDESSHPHP